jgi:hypothetical protein
MDSNLLTENQGLAQMQSANFHREPTEAIGPRVLLTDTNRWPSPARVAMGLAKAGCAVSAVCPAYGHPLLFTSAVTETFTYSSLRPLKSLADAIEKCQPQIIIPCDDRGVLHLHELYDHAQKQGASGANLTGLIEFSLGPSASYPVVSRRHELLRAAAEEGIRVPETRQLTGPADLKSWQAEHRFPWVLKGDGTFGGRGVRVANTLDQAVECFAEINGLFAASRAIKRAIVNRDPFWLRPWWQNHRPAVIVQSHIQGRPANCAVLSWKGKIQAGVAVEVISSDGQTGPASVVRVIDNAEMMYAAERIAQRLELSGFFGLDFMIEEGSHKPYLIEMNPRSTPLSHLQLGQGRDLMEALAAQLSGRPIRDTVPVTQNDTIAYFPQAWHSDSDRELLLTSFQDIPEGEPDLVKALLRPWPERSLLFRLVSKANVLKSSA